VEGLEEKLFGVPLFFKLYIKKFKLYSTPKPSKHPKQKRQKKKKKFYKRKKNKKKKKRT